MGDVPGEKDPKAVTAMILGIVSLVFTFISFGCGVGWILSLILGIVAMSMGMGVRRRVAAGVYSEGGTEGLVGALTGVAGALLSGLILLAVLLAVIVLAATGNL